LAVGLGMGAAVAAVGCPPGIASADPTAFDPNNFAVSIDGFTLFQEGTATATSGTGDLAIADGANSSAVADSGFLDMASAFGTDSEATTVGAGASPGGLDVASAFGTDSEADSFGGFFDAASASGTGSTALVGVFNTPGSFDVASAFGNAFAAAGDGNFDNAVTFDPFGTITSAAFAEHGSGDYASIFGDGDSAMAGGPGNLLGNGDIAAVFGNDSTALAGADLTGNTGNFDLAADFGNMLDANATGANFLIEVMTILGNLGL
jgi:hypothetical protein